MKLAWIAVIEVFLAGSAMAQIAIPDLRGTWKGESESVVLGVDNSHYGPEMPDIEPRLRTLSFTLTIDKQDGRRFTGEIFI